MAKDCPPSCPDHAQEVLQTPETQSVKETRQAVKSTMDSDGYLFFEENCGDIAFGD